MEAIAQLHALVEQAQGILQTLVAGEDAATSEAPAAPAKRAVAEFDKDAGAVLDKRLDRLDAMLADLLKRVKNIEAQPLPLPLSGATRTVSKGEERDAGLENLLADPDALSLLAIKLAQRNGRSFLTR